MAEQILSPGVFTREQDTSFLSPAPAAVSTAVVGPTVKGPVNVPTVVSSFGEYSAIFGTDFVSGSDVYSHFTAVTAEKFFEQGGDSLLVTRVANGTFTEAVAEIVSGSTTLFTLETLGAGEIMNNSGSVGSNGELTSGGSVDNVRWEIQSIDTTTGEFTLIVRRGDDNDKNKVILETFSDVSLDPKSNNYIAARIGDSYAVPNGEYVEVRGDYENKSAYIRVASVDYKMTDYVDNTGAANTTYAGVLTGLSNALGTAGYTEGGAFDSATGSILGAGANFYEDIDATNTQGLPASAGDVAAYTTAASLLGNAEAYTFNVLLTPGLNLNQHNVVVGKFIDLVEERGDAFYVVDPSPYDRSVTDAAADAASQNSSYAAAYWPWVKLQTQVVGNQVWAPASAVMGGVLAFSDGVSAEWYAPAGLNRGGIPGVVRAEKKLTRSDRDALYQSRVNPLASFPGQGVVVYGQKTLQKKSSALDRVNVRRLLINLKRFVDSQANNLLFEQNTIATRNRFLSLINPYMDGVVQNQGLYAYRVVMDDTNNTADVIDRNQLVGQIYIQPTKTAEFIVLDFSVVPSGITF